VPVFPVVDRVPYYGYSATPLSDIATSFAASEYGDVAYSQRVVAASLEIGVVVHSTNSSLSHGSFLLSPLLRSSPLIDVARSSFGVRSDWVPVFQDSALVDANTSANAPNIQQAWCVLKTEALAADGGVFISSSGAGAVLVAATRCGVGSVANISIQSAVSSASSEMLNFGDDGMGTTFIGRNYLLSKYQTALALELATRARARNYLFTQTTNEKRETLKLK
jgi:hypothetical protein